MNVEITSCLRGTRLREWKKLIEESGLIADAQADQTVLVWDEDELVATGARAENIFKYIAVKANRQGEDLTATVLSALRREAFADGYKHLFLYTKPENERIFSSLFFYPVAATDKVLLMESRRDGVAEFISSLGAARKEGRVGALVMNCNPFTLGHRYLIERAASECDHVYVFVLSEDKSLFSAKDRIEMVRLGTEHLTNVTVLPTGPYLISSATFPTYFIKDRESVAEIQCLLDIEIFIRYFAPAFSINARYVGTEPLSPVTEKYNRALAEHLPGRNIELVEMERAEAEGAPISASRVRACIDRKDLETLKSLLPQTTIDYLINNRLI